MHEVMKHNYFDVVMRKNFRLREQLNDLKTENMMKWNGLIWCTVYQEREEITWFKIQQSRKNMPQLPMEIKIMLPFGEAREAKSSTWGDPGAGHKILKDWSISAIHGHIRS